MPKINKNKKTNVYNEITKWTKDENTKNVLLGTAMIDKQKYRSNVTPYVKESAATKMKIRICHRYLNEDNFDHVRKFETFVKKYNTK